MQIQYQRWSSKSSEKTMQITQACIVDKRRPHPADTDSRPAGLELMMRCLVLPQVAAEFLKARTLIFEKHTRDRLIWGILPVNAELARNELSS
jgi:hypothetical protein